MRTTKVAYLLAVTVFATLLQSVTSCITVEDSAALVTALANTHVEPCIDLVAGSTYDLDDTQYITPCGDDEPCFRCYCCSADL